MRSQRGLGLVELMVGMFISVLIVLAAMASLSFYQSSQRTSVSGNSALANAVSGLYLMGNDLRHAGLGLTATKQIACTSLNAFYNGSVRSNGGLLAPVNIVDNNGTNPDSISIMYGDAIDGGAPAMLLSSQASPTSTFSLPLSMSVGLQNGSQALLGIPGSNLPCTLVAVTGIDTSSGTTAVISISSSSLYNAPNPSGAFTNPVTYSNTGYFMNMKQFHWNTWSIVNGTLQVTDNITGQVQTIADNVVQMHAEYGVTNGSNPGIAQWVRATGTWTPLTATTIPQIVAVRLALVTRSTQPEKANAAGVCSTTTIAPSSWTGSPAMNLSSNANWSCYRYKVVRMVFPLKNIVWGT